MRDPVIYRSIVEAEDVRSTWKQRVARIISLMHEAAADVSDLSLPTCVQDVIDSGLLLGNSSEEQGGGGGGHAPPPPVGAAGAAESDGGTAVAAHDDGASVGVGGGGFRGGPGAGTAGAGAAEEEAAGAAEIGSLSGMNRDVLRGMLDSVTRPTVVDVNLYNDPRHGFMVNVGEARRTVIVYGVRQPPPRSDGTNEPSQSVSQVLLEPFNLRVFYPGEPAPAGPSDRDLLVLYSFCGKKVCDYPDFLSLIEDVKNSDDISRWRLLFYPITNLNFIPTACTFRGPPEHHHHHHHLHLPAGAAAGQETE